MDRKKRKKSNAGMSLLEVIVAVSIFSITAAVLLQSFVTSQRINKKSNLYLEATTVAQNIMEEVKASSLEKISRAFNYPKYKFNFLNSLENAGIVVGIREVLPSADSGTHYSSVRLYKKDSDAGKSDEELASIVTASVISKDGGITYTLNPRKSGTYASKYFFELTNVKSSADANENFDALIKFDGSKDSNYKKKNNTDPDEKNDIEIPNIAKLNTKTDAIISIEKEQWWDAFLTFFGNKTNELGNPLYTEAEIYQMFQKASREIVVTLKAESGDVINVEEKYTITYEDFTYSENISVLRTDDLKNVCIFYYPNYNSTGSGSKALDSIEFDNSINKEVNLYVAKQKDTTITSENEYRIMENAYRMKMTIIEKNKYENWSTNPSLYSGVTKLRTNLGYNIASEDMEKRDKVNSQMFLTYSSRGITRNNEAARKMVKYNTLDDKEAKDRIYTTKVEVYKAGAAEKGFPSDELIVSLDGSKEG